MAVIVITPPTEEPVSLAEAKLHLRIDHNADDSLVSGLITAARAYIEQVIDRALVTQTLEYVTDEWPDGDDIELPRAPLQSVASLTYKSYDGNTATVSSSDYAVSTAETPGELYLLTGRVWPSTLLYPADPIRVRYTAGYGAASAVPQPIKQAILLLVGHWYENREAVTVGAVGRDVPMSVEMLLWPYRVITL